MAGEGGYLEGVWKTGSRVLPACKGTKENQELSQPIPVSADLKVSQRCFIWVLGSFCRLVSST